MKKKDGHRELFVIGDRVLIEPDNKEQKTNIGLYLPQTVVEKAEVQEGWVINIGPGIPLAEPGSTGDEPWKHMRSAPKYLPMQVKEGDYAIFIKKMAVEIKWQESHYLIIPQSAILVVMRESLNNIDIDIEDF